MHCLQACVIVSTPAALCVAQVRRLQSEVRLGPGRAPLPKGTRVAVDVYSMQRNPALWRDPHR